MRCKIPCDFVVCVAFPWQTVDVNDVIEHLTFAEYFLVLYLSQHTRFRYVLYKRKRLRSTHILASHEILVLNASASSDGSDELARMRSIVRAFDSYKHIIWKKRQNIRPTAPLNGDTSKSLANRLRSHL